LISNLREAATTGVIHPSRLHEAANTIEICTTDGSKILQDINEAINTIKFLDERDKNEN
jgi:hypothetical protein